MKVVTAQQMQDIEHLAAGEGFPPEVLMENAGLAVAREVEGELGDVRRKRILILVGPGNNGGDGLVAARHLHDWGAEAWLYICGRKKHPDPNYELALGRGIVSTRAAEDAGFSILDDMLSSADLVVDALFGTGKTRPLEGIFKQILTRVKEAKKKRPELTITALDLPSGLDPDCGLPDPSCLQADVTVTLGYPKLGLFSHPGVERIGRLVVADIGIPPAIAPDISTRLITSEWASSVLPKRPPDANKGTFGRVLVIGGSSSYIGAVCLACAAATRVGAGLVTLAAARSIQPILASKLTEVTYLPLPESGPGAISKEASGIISEQLKVYDALLLGCGLGQDPATIEFIRSILPSLSEGSIDIILDADALNILARTPGWWKELGRDAILTPHPGEMSRLMGVSVSQIQSKRLESALEMSARWHKTIVLKGARTVVTSPDGRGRISPAANPGLASAGTGDVLAGIIAGLLAQGLSLFDAAACGVCLHAMAGELTEGRLGDSGMIASDLIHILPVAIKKLKAGKE